MKEPFLGEDVWSDVRRVIQRELNLQCIFPVSDRRKTTTTSNQLTARCMHERKEDNKDSLSDFLEDVIVKVKKYARNEIGDGSSSLSTKQVNISILISFLLSSRCVNVCNFFFYRLSKKFWKEYLKMPPYTVMAVDGGLSTLT